MTYHEPTPYTTHPIQDMKIHSRDELKGETKRSKSDIFYIIFVSAHNVD